MHLFVLHSSTAELLWQKCIAVNAFGSSVEPQPLQPPANLRLYTAITNPSFAADE